MGKSSINGPSIPWQHVSHNQRVQYFTNLKFRPKNGMISLKSTLMIPWLRRTGGELIQFQGKLIGLPDMVMTNIAIEHGPFIVDFPMKHGNTEGNVLIFLLVVLSGYES